MQTLADVALMVEEYLPAGHGVQADEPVCEA